MEQLDLSVLPTIEKDEVLKNLLDGTMSVEEARTYLQTTMSGVKDQKSNALATTLKDGNPETGEVPIESPHAAYRNSMVDYAKENESNEDAELVEKWNELTQQYIKDGLIKESDQGKEFVDIGLISVSKLVNDSVVRQAFKEGEYVTLKYIDHTGVTQSRLGVKKSILNAFMKDPNKSFEGANKLMRKSNLNKILRWIEKKYKTNNPTEQLYIYHMIDPDILGHCWLDKTNGKYSSCIVSGRSIEDRSVDSINRPGVLCGLSVIQKC